MLAAIVGALLTVDNHLSSSGKRVSCSKKVNKIFDWTACRGVGQTEEETALKPLYESACW